jgi:hypothetical protein
MKPVKEIFSNENLSIFGPIREEDMRNEFPEPDTEIYIPSLYLNISGALQQNTTRAGNPEFCFFRHGGAQNFADFCCTARVLCFS